MITLISTILGLISGVLPSVVKIFEKKQEYKYELQLMELKIRAAEQGLYYEHLSQSIKADVDEGKSLRLHDTSIASGRIMEAVRASVRPVLTYFFFILFVTVKLTAATMMYKSGTDPIEILKATWDIYTASIFGAIIAFWFGSRAMEKISQAYSVVKKIEKDK